MLCKMSVKVATLVLLMMLWKSLDISAAEGLDINSKLNELSNDVNDLTNKFDQQVNTIEEIMQELRGEENFLLSTLTGQQRAMESKIDVMKNIQDQMKKEQGQIIHTQDNIKQKLEQIKDETQGEMQEVQRQMNETTDQINQTQNDVKQELLQIKITQGQNKQEQVQIKVIQEQMQQIQEVMKQEQGQIKVVQEQMKQTQKDMKQEQSQMKDIQGQMKQTLEDMKQEQSQMKQTQIEMKQTQDENHRITKAMMELLTAFCKRTVPNLQTQTLNGKRYYFSSVEPHMSWLDANKFCKSHGMQLVSVDSQQEWDALKPEIEKQFAKSSWFRWSSGSDTAEEGKWTWTATGNDVTFFAGKKDMNNNIDENCLFLNNEGWGDMNCDNERPFICEQDTLC